MERTLFQKDKTNLDDCLNQISKNRTELIEKLKEPVGRKYPLTPDKCFSTAQLMVEFNKQFVKSQPSREYALNIAAKVPVTCLQELFDNAEKIQEWLKEPVVNDDMKYFDCSAV